MNPRGYLWSICWRLATPKSLLMPIPHSHFSLFYFIFINLFIYLFVYGCIGSLLLGLHCCKQAFSSCGERGLLFIVVHGLLIVVASLVAELGL